MFDSYVQIFRKIQVAPERDLDAVGRDRGLAAGFFELTLPFDPLIFTLECVGDFFRSWIDEQRTLRPVENDGLARCDTF